MGKDQVTVLVASVLIYTSNQWCRSLLFSTVNFESSDAYRFTNIELGLTEREYSVLGTVAFNALFSLASLVAGAAVDALDARVLSAGACGAWSIATIAIGRADSFEGMVTLRAIQGLAMSATAPAGYSLLARTFDSSKLAGANSAFASAVSIGGALASASVLLDDRFGWRNTFGIVGSVSLAIAALGGVLLTSSTIRPLDSPMTANSESNKTPRAFSAAAIAIFAATATRFCAGFAIAVWTLPLLRATFPDRSADLGLAYALLVAAAGSASALLGGRIADACPDFKAKLPAPFSRNANAARAIVPTIGSILAAPLFYAALQAQDFSHAIVLLTLEFLVAECWIGPTTALLAASCDPRQRGFAQGIFTSLTLVGNLAPIAIGAALEKGLVDSPKLLLSTVVLAAYLSSSLAFTIVAFLLNDPEAQARAKPD